MTAKELQKLRRSDLLEMLLELRRENDRLRKQLEAAQRRLEDRRIDIEESGSLAEAALRLNGIFEAAEAACEQYAENMRARMEQQEREAKEKYDALIAQAEKQANEYGWLDEIMRTP